MRTNIEESDEKPALVNTDPGCTPAGHSTGNAAGSGGGGEHGLDQDPTATFPSEGGYHTFSEASLDPQYSQGMEGLHINNTSFSSVRTRSGATAIGRDNEHGGDNSIAQEPEAFPLSGGGYSPFSSASLVASGPSNSMPKPPVTPLTTKWLGGDRSGQDASVNASAGGGGSGDDVGKGASGRERRVPEPASSGLENRLDGTNVPLESGERRRDGNPIPLSPDALTPFSRGDPEAKERDR